MLTMPSKTPTSPLDGANAKPTVLDEDGAKAVHAWERNSPTQKPGRFILMKRQKVVWKIVVGALILAGFYGSRNSPPPTDSEAEFAGYNLGRIVFWIAGVYLLVTGIRGRVPKG